VADCVPQADVVIVHAEARDLCRLLGRREVAPVLMSELSSESLTEAYAAMKLLSQRCGLMAFDLLVGMASRPRRAERVADRLASCADNFLSAVLRSWAPVDRDLPITAPVSTELERLAANQLTGLEGHSALSLPAAGAVAAWPWPWIERRETTPCTPPQVALIPAPCSSSTARWCAAWPTR
jgi:flagellar biosynthesis protein FlhG